RQREHEQQPDQRPPEQAADRTLGHRVVRGRGDVHLAVLFAPDDGRVLQIHQVVVPQLDELGPDVVGPVLVRVTDDDQVTHSGDSLRWPAYPASVTAPGQRTSSDLVVRGRPRDYQVGGCVRRRGREAWAVSTRRDQLSHQATGRRVTEVPRRRCSWQRFRSAAAGGTLPSSTPPASSRTSTTAWVS